MAKLRRNYYTSPTMPSSSSELSFPDPLPESEAFLLGYVDAKIGGLGYHNPNIKGEERISLIHDHRYAYGSNGIAIMDVRMTKVSYIKPSVTTVLSPLLDRNLILVQEFVPKFQAKKDMSLFKVPCQVHVFTRVETLESVSEEIVARRLKLILHEYDDVRLGMFECEESGVKNVGDVFKLAKEAVSKKDELEAIKSPKNVIKSKLFQHQKDGLGWLVGRENSVDLPPFWEESDGSYRNQLTGKKTDVRPEPLRGGIVAQLNNIVIALNSLVNFSTLFKLHLFSLVKWLRLSIAAKCIYHADKREQKS